MAIDNSGPAYPFEGGDNNGMQPCYGMTLRDAFAIAALQGGGAFNWRDNDYTPVDGLSIIENSARHAYLIADAMIRARTQDASHE